MPRSLANASKNGETRSTMDEARKPTSKSSKYKKSVTTAARKYNSGTKSHDRLVGGADVPEAEETSNAAEKVSEVTSPTTDATNGNELKEQGKSAPSSGPCCFCVSHISGTTGDKKVDEMIDYVHQNLQEACKTLATLGENFEHDSKLMFVDILGRIQHWSGMVQNKLETCKNDIEALRKELIARVCEIGNKDREIADLKARLAECEANSALLAKQQKEAELVEAAPEQVEENGAQKLVETQTPDSKQDHRVEEQPRISDTQAKDLKNAKDSKDPRDSKDYKDSKDSEVTYTNVAVQSGKDKDRTKREMELESELSRLRKENERIMKERADYENAIQRALLRGVSSLNVEALRVLRCPPMPCCTPCAPCPTPAPPEPIVPCKNTKDGSSKTCNVGQPDVCTRSASHKRNVCTVKRPCGRPCCSAEKGTRKPSGNSMIFLLHQTDAGNICGNETPVPKVCGSPFIKKIEIPPCPRYV